MRTALAIAGLFSALLLTAIASPSARADAGPQPPRDIYAEAPRADQVVLTWRPGVEAPPGQATPTGEHYQVFRNGQLIADTTQLKLSDAWLAEQTRYEYVVQAIDSAGLAAAAPALAVTTPPFAAGLELQPYLQQLSPTRAVIVWQTFAPATTSLYFGPAGGPHVNVARNMKLTRDHVVVVDGLTPASTYSYRWESDGRIGPQADFGTPAASPQSFRFGVIGDFGVPTPAAHANLRRLAGDGLDFAITTGDNAQIFGNEEEYRNYVLGPIQDFIARRPLWPSVGNHDYYGLANYRRYFALPGNERYYAFTYGSALFVALDSNRYDGRQKSWMRRVLGRSPAQCKIAYFHHPLWSSGRGYRNHVRKRRREKIASILQRGGVDLVLNGHVQNYERSKPLRSARINRRRGILYVVTGGGGARLTAFATKRRPRWSARRGAFHHRLHVIITGDRVSAKAIDTAGRTRDRFKLRCRP